MKRGSISLRIVAVISSIVLVGAYICYQVGVIRLPFVAAQTSPRMMSSSKIGHIGPALASATQSAPAPAKSTPGNQDVSDFVLMSGSKSGHIGVTVLYPNTTQPIFFDKSPTLTLSELPLPTTKPAAPTTLPTTQPVLNPAGGF